MGSVHRPGRWAFEIYALAVIAASVTRTFELVFTGFPIGSTAQMSAACIDYENPIGGLRHPNAVLLLPFCIYAKCVITWRTDAEGAGRLKDCSRQEKTQKH